MAGTTVAYQAVVANCKTVLTLIYCAGRENRCVRHFERYNRDTDVLCLEEQKLPHWIDRRYVIKKKDFVA